MKNCKRFFCGIVAFFLAFGAGYAAVSLSQSGFNVAHAEVTENEPVSELHLDQSKIKRVSAHYEIMAGPYGSNITAYVFEGAGNLYDGSTFPEFRFMTEGSNGSTKIAYASDVKYVNFWYKLTNANETQMIDVEAVPYLLQVVTSDGQYPCYSFSPINDGQWHSWLMEVRGEDYARFAGVLIELGDLNGSIAVADLRLNTKISETQPTGELHLEPEKIKGYTEHHYELMEGLTGSEVNTYVFSANGGCTKNPEVRFVTEGTQTVSKPYTLVTIPNAEVTAVTFDYKLSTTVSKQVDDGTMEYLLQVLGSDGTYPLHDWQPVNDGQWHSWTMDVTNSLNSQDYRDKFAGIVVKMGDINGSLTLANIRLTKTTTLVYLDELVTFKTFLQTYFESERNNATLMLDLNARVFANSSFDTDSSEETFINDHNALMKNKAGVATNVQNAIIIGGKTLGEWMDLHVDVADMCETRWPINDLSDAYRPVTVRVCRTDTSSNQWLQIDVCLSYISIMDFTVEFNSELFEIYNGETTFKFQNNVKFYPTIPTNTEPNSNTITYVRQETRKSVTGTFLNNNTSIEDYNEGKSLRMYIYTNLEPAFGTTYPGNVHCIDHLQYIANSILINGVKLSTFSAYAWRDGYHTVGSIYDAKSPANDNFAWPARAEFMNDNGKLCLRIAVNKAALGAYTSVDRLDTVTIADDFTFVDAGGDLCKLVSDVTLKYDETSRKFFLADEETVFEPTSAFFTEMNFPDGSKIPTIVVKSKDPMKWGFNISDKAPYQHNLNKVLINGKSIAQINEEFGPNISLEEYAMADFELYGKDGSGIPVSSPLTKPIISNAPSGQSPSGDGEYTFNIMMHPKYFATISPIGKLTVQFLDGFRVASDTLEMYTLKAGVTLVARESSLQDSTEDQVAENSLIRNIGLYNPDHSKNCVKQFDQTADSLVYKKDANDHTGLYFSNSNSSTHGEFRVYMPGNAYKAESKGYAMTQLTFDYMLFDSGVATETGRNHSISPEGNYVENAATATNKVTIQALLHDASNMYYDIDVELINDGQLHTFTLNLAYADVMGFVFVLWNFNGEFFISNVVADYLPYDEALNNFVVNTLKMFAITDNETGWQDNVGPALEAFEQLSEDEQNLFNTHAAYGSARARFNNWKNLKAAADLAAYKVEKKGYIDTTVAAIIGNYRQAEQQMINAGADGAKADIDNANSIEQVNEILDNLSNQLASLKTAAQYEAEEALAAAKATAKGELDAIDLTVYRDAEKTTVQGLIAAGKETIDAQESIENVNTQLANIKETIAAVKTDAQLTAEELAAYKVEKKQLVDDTVAAIINDYREAEQGQVNTIAGNTKTAIDAAENIAAVDTLLNDMFLQLVAVKTAAQYEEEEALAAAKVSAKAELDAIDLTVYRDAEKETVQGLISAGKETIDAQTSINGVEVELANIKETIAAVKTAAQYEAEEAAAALAAAKLAAKQEIEAYAASKGQSNYSAERN